MKKRISNKDYCESEKLPFEDEWTELIDKWLEEDDEEKAQEYFRQSEELLEAVKTRGLYDFEGNFIGIKEEWGIRFPKDNVEIKWNNLD